MAEWWERFFDEVYLRLWAEPIGREQTEEQVAGVLKILDLPSGAEILDLACGHGRHTVPFAQAAYQMTGLDRSEMFLEKARQAAREAGVQVSAPFRSQATMPPS